MPPYQSRAAGAVLFVQTLLTMQAGCSSAHPQAEAPSVAAETDPTTSTFGDGTDRRFNFGHVIGGPARRLSHTYTLRNMSEKPIGIVSVVNGMLCCGEVGPIQAAKLLPGQTLDVIVTIRPTRIGPLRHWVSVKTDRPEADEVLLVTLADVHAPVESKHRSTESPGSRPARVSRSISSLSNACPKTPGKLTIPQDSLSQYLNGRRRPVGRGRRENDLSPTG